MYVIVSSCVCARSAVSVPLSSSNLVELRFQLELLLQYRQTFRLAVGGAGFVDLVREVLGPKRESL